MPKLRAGRERERPPGLEAYEQEWEAYEQAIADYERLKAECGVTAAHERKDAAHEAVAPRKSNCLKDVIGAYRTAAGINLDERAATLLARLEASKEAADAFTLFGGFRQSRFAPDVAAGHVLYECIRAYGLAKTFGERIEVEQNLLGTGDNPGRIEKLAGAVKYLHSFIKEIDCEPDREASPGKEKMNCKPKPSADGLTAFITYDNEDRIAMRRGLYLVADAIYARQRIAKETLLRLGATRKSVDRGEAGKTAAIGWLAIAVRRICGKPHHAAVKTLAETILGGEIEIDRMRNAERAHKREWRQPASTSSRSSRSAPEWLWQELGLESEHSRRK